MPLDTVHRKAAIPAYPSLSNLLWTSAVTNYNTANRQKDSRSGSEDEYNL
jgi:hypothetical protein